LFMGFAFRFGRNALDKEGRLVKDFSTEVLAGPLEDFFSRSDAAAHAYAFVSSRLARATPSNLDVLQGDELDLAFDVMKAEVNRLRSLDVLNVEQMAAVRESIDKWRSSIRAIEQAKPQTASPSRVSKTRRKQTKVPRIPKVRLEEAEHFLTSMSARISTIRRRGANASAEEKVALEAWEKALEVRRPDDLWWREFAAVVMKSKPATSSTAVQGLVDYLAGEELNEFLCRGTRAYLAEWAQATRRARLHVRGLARGWEVGEYPIGLLDGKHKKLGDGAILYVNHELKIVAFNRYFEFKKGVMSQALDQEAELIERALERGVRLPNRPGEVYKVVAPGLVPMKATFASGGRPLSERSLASRFLRSAFSAEMDHSYFPAPLKATQLSALTKLFLREAGKIP
jgi:hypothetical protein